MVEQQVDDRRNDHPAERARHRQYRPRNVERCPETTSLYLQADGEKEHHHQAVIDETFEVETEPETADRNAYRCLQQRMVKLAVAGILARSMATTTKNSSTTLPAHWVLKKLRPF